MNAGALQLYCLYFLKIKFQLITLVQESKLFI